MYKYFRFFIVKILVSLFFTPKGIVKVEKSMEKNRFFTEKVEFLMMGV